MQLKRLYGRIGFNFEYLLLIIFFVGVLFVAFCFFYKPDVKDGAAWFQGVGIISTLIAALCIPAIQRKHAYLQSDEEYAKYTSKAYEVASQAVEVVAKFKEVEKLFVTKIEHRLLANELDVLVEAIGSFEVSKMSSANGAIALLRIKQQIKDASIVYATTLEGNDEKIMAMGLIEGLANNAMRELVTLKAEVHVI